MLYLYPRIKGDLLFEVFHFVFLGCFTVRFCDVTLFKFGDNYHEKPSLLTFKKSSRRNQAEALETPKPRSRTPNEAS